MLKTQEFSSIIFEDYKGVFSHFSGGLSFISGQTTDERHFSLEGFQLTSGEGIVLRDIRCHKEL